MRWFVAIAFTLLVCFGAFGAFIACTDDTTTTTYIPETGITVRADSITNGIGCGSADGQIYKYVAIAVNSATPPGASVGGLFDCYSDAVLANIPPTPDSSSLSYTVLIYAWDETAYNANIAQITTLVASLDPNSPPQDAAVLAQSFLAGTTATADRPAIPGTNPTYYTPLSAACVAQQIINIQVVAACPPLTPYGLLMEDAGASDAGSAQDADASTDSSTTDGSSDASTPDAADASDADDGSTD